MNLAPGGSFTLTGNATRNQEKAVSSPALQASPRKRRAADLLAAITSRLPTRYKLIAGERNEPIYVYCALDTLEYAWITASSYRAVAEPPAGAAVQFMLTPLGPEPAAVWMSTVIPEHMARLPSIEGLPSRCCLYVHFSLRKTRTKPGTVRCLRRSFRLSNASR
ncbi:MAG: hypothetical protein ACRETQ_01340 [Gammaproteobacteria bacterium]